MSSGPHEPFAPATLAAGGTPSSGDSVAVKFLSALTSGERPGLTIASLVLLAYIALAGLAAFYHEPWFDEAQAWLIARESSVFELPNALRYEGHPALWYVILMLPAKLGMPFQYLPLLSVAIASVGVAVLLLAPGVPRAVRFIAPFSYVILYQYAVVARSYVLIPLLLFAIAAAWRQRFERPVIFAILLALLINVSLHGAILAFTIFVSWSLDWHRRSGFSEWRRAAMPLILLAIASALFFAATLPVPADLSIREKIEQEWSMRLRNATLLGIQSALLPWAIPAVGALLLILPWLRARRVLGLTIAQLLGITVVAGIYMNVWHLGLYSCVLLFAFCIALNSEPREHCRAEPILGRIAVVTFAFVLILQAIDGYRAVRVDVETPYSGSQAAAEALAQLPLDRVTLFGLGFPALAVQGYFREAIFDNYGEPLWWRWSTSSPWYIEGRGGIRVINLANWLRQALAARPDYLLLPLKFPTDRIPLSIVANRPDYEFVAAFPGSVQWRGRELEPESLVLFRRVGSAAPLPKLHFDPTPQIERR